MPKTRTVSRRLVAPAFFRAVATALAAVLSLEQLEVLLEVARANLMSAHLVEEEVAGVCL